MTKDELELLIDNLNESGTSKGSKTGDGIMYKQGDTVPKTHGTQYNFPISMGTNYKLDGSNPFSAVSSSDIKKLTSPDKTPKTCTGNSCQVCNSETCTCDCPEEVIQTVQSLNSIIYALSAKLIDLEKELEELKKKIANVKKGPQGVPGPRGKSSTVTAGCGINLSGNVLSFDAASVAGTGLTTTGSCQISVDTEVYTSITIFSPSDYAITQNETNPCYLTFEVTGYNNTFNFNSAGICVGVNVAGSPTTYTQELYIPCS